MLRFVRAELAELNTDRKALRQFGLLMALVLGAITAFILWRRGLPPTTPATVLASCTAVFLIAALLAPVVLRPVYLVWMALAVLLGFVVTRIILSIVFYLVVTPIGVALRIFGKDPLTKGPDPSADTYWIPKVYRTKDRERFEKYY